MKSTEDIDLAIRFMTPLLELDNDIVVRKGRFGILVLHSGVSSSVKMIDKVGAKAIIEDMERHGFLDDDVLARCYVSECRITKSTDEVLRQCRDIGKAIEYAKNDAVDMDKHERLNVIKELQGLFLGH